jgi:anthranilate phosphoribosyltransferase
MLGCEGTPPKEGRTVFDALRNLGVTSPPGLEEAGEDLAEHGFAATSMDHYLPSLHALLDLRHEIVRRTVLNVVEKIISPIPDSRLAVGVTHQPFLKSLSATLVDLGIEDALIFQAVEGSDEAPLDGNSSLVRVRDGAAEEFRIPPESIGLSRTTRAHIPWKGAEDEARNVLNALGGEESPAKSLILYNAALRLWTASDASLAVQVEKADEALRSGAALELLSKLRRPATVEAFSA